MKDGKTLVVVVGPTAVGKTALSIRLAEHFSTEIISADSRQVYRELDIGTAKPSKDELTRIKHYFIDHRSVGESYDAGTFAKEAMTVIGTIFSTHDVAVMCGGSGLYVKALLEGFDDFPPVEEKLRDGIRKEYETKGLAWLQDEISVHDPDYFDAVDRQNPQRLMRALEVIRSTGKPFSGFHAKTKVDLPFRVIKVGLEMDRPQLYARIDRRMDEMIEIGLFEEAEKFRSLSDSNALQTVGYQEVYSYLNKSYDREEAIRLMKRNSRRYAKRQMTWFRKDKEIQWFRPEQWKEILQYIEGVI